MSFEVEAMNLGLIDDVEINKPFDSLTVARVCAQVLGPNEQNGVSQAVQGETDEVERFFRILAEMGYAGDSPYKLLSWIGYHIGRGDPNCANYFTWAGLLMEGNLDVFARIRDKMMVVLRTYHPERTDVHPELCEILNRGYGSTHFTSVRIPRVTLSSDESCLWIEWPGDLSGTVGTPPVVISFGYGGGSA